MNLADIIRRASRLVCISGCVFAALQPQVAAAYEAGASGTRAGVTTLEMYSDEVYSSCSLTAYAPDVVDDRFSISSSVDCTEQVQVVFVSTALQIHLNGETSILLGYGGNETFENITSTPRLRYTDPETCATPDGGSDVPLFRTIASIRVLFADGTWRDAEAYSPFVSLDCAI